MDDDASNNQQDGAGGGSGNVAEVSDVAEGSADQAQPGGGQDQVHVSSLLCTLRFGNFFVVQDDQHSDMDLDLLAESESDSDNENEGPQQGQSDGQAG